MLERLSHRPARQKPVLVACLSAVVLGGPAAAQDSVHWTDADLSTMTGPRFVAPPAPPAPVDRHSELARVLGEVLRDALGDRPAPPPMSDLEALQHRQRAWATAWFYTDYAPLDEAMRIDPPPGGLPSVVRRHFEGRRTDR